MGPLIALLIFLGLVVAWAFFSFQPEYANKRALSVFNWTIIGACAMMCLAWAFNIEHVLKKEDYAKFRGAFAIIGALGIECVWLSVMFVIRNFWLFKPPRRPGSWG